MRRNTTLIARLMDAAVPGRAVRAAPLRWSVSPENLPYAIHVGVQPELIPTAEVIVGRLASGSPSLPPGEEVRGQYCGDEWILEPVPRH